MRAAGISGLVKVKRGRTTIRVPGVRVADDLVERKFRPEAPDVLWVTDITYLRTWEGWLYLAAVQDAYSRRIVGWAMTEHMRTELVHRQPWPSRRDLSSAVFEYIEAFYNRQRRHSTLGYLSLEEYENTTITTTKET